ncbi:hypothetical protein ACN47E_000625 [Coniothyrium glycines]
MTQRMVVARDKQLRESVFRALSQERVRKTRLAHLQEELQRLERDLEADKKATQSQLEAFAQAECMQLTTAMMTKLPREIRDMVLRHLSTRHNELIEREYFRTTIDPETRLYSYDHARWKAEHFSEHFWDPAYTGQAFYRELVENYYRTSTFLFNDDPGVMAKFLLTDGFQMNFLPRDLVQNAEMHLNAISYDRGSFRTYLFGVPKSPETLQEALDGIFELRPSANIKICYTTDTREGKNREEHFQAGLRTLLGSVQRARLDGYEVSFVVDKKWKVDLAKETSGEWAGLHGLST